jgi:hypothetical protein
MRRVLVVATVGLFVGFGLGGAAHAQSGTCSDTTLVPGQSVSVVGSDADPGSSITLRFDGSIIGATTADGFGNFTVTGTIPASAVPGTYTIDVLANPTNFTACTVTVQNLPVATASPSPTATPDPDDDDDDDDDIDVDDLADIIDALGRDGGGQQQQQQQQAVPVILPAGGSHGGGGGSKTGGPSLPKTGADAAEVGGIGTASLLTGISLVEFARRRRRHWLAPVSASEALATTSVAPRGSSEGDLLLPFFADGPARNTTPPAGGGNFISPGF